MKAIICAAGMGTRLGWNIPKALVEINNKRLLELQLRALKGFDVTVVIGYKYDLVMPIIYDYGCDYVVNNSYATSNTSYSIGLAYKHLKNINEPCLILDGDLLFTNEHLTTLDFSKQWIGVTPIRSEKPVFVDIYNNNVIGFEHGSYEWSCMCYVKPEMFKDATNEYVYKILEKHLPISAQKVNTFEIDTINDYNGALEWIHSQTL